MGNHALIRGETVTEGTPVYHLDGARGQVEKVYQDGTILVRWNDGTRNRWDTDEHHHILTTSLNTNKP